MCKHCRHIFIAETPLVDKHCQLSDNFKIAITLALQDTRSMASIAHDYDISIPSVTRIQNRIAEKLKPSLYWLPKHLSLDELKLVKSVKGKLSCIIIDNHTHRLSNGPIEGCNNKIKNIKWVSYGYRSFDNFTNRIRIQFL